MFEYDVNKPNINIITACDSEPIKDAKHALEKCQEGQLWKERYLIYSTTINMQL